MNGGHLPPHQPILLGQQPTQDEAQQAIAINYFFNLYMQLVPVVAAARLAEDIRTHGDHPWEDREEHEQTPLLDQRIAEEAERIAITACHQVGFPIAKKRKGKG